MVFPPSQARKGRLSAVFIGFHLTADGRVGSAKILGEVPHDSEFGKTALAAVKKLQAQNGFEKSEACMKNRVINIMFTFK